MAWYGDYGRWKPYVPVARRRANAAGFAARLAKKIAGVKSVDNQLSVVQRGLKK